jgi:hypothetical protein
MSVAASYVSDYAHHSVKQLFVDRAALLFHITHQNDQMVLVQSALLLSFWFAEAEDVKQSWYWSGVAFSIAQSLGLHRDFGGPSQREEAVRRNLWRACMFRDVWLSFGMGRPLRLYARDSDVSIQPNDDYQFQDLTLFDDDVSLYGESECSEIFNMWQSLVYLSSVLRQILLKDLQPIDDLSDLGTKQLASEGSTLPTRIFRRHLELHRFAVQMAHDREDDIANSTRLATTGMVSVLREFLEDGSVKYAAPIAVPLIAPVMMTLLNGSKSNNHEVAKSAAEGMSLCIRFLEALERNYPAAAILKRLAVAAHGSSPGIAHSRKNLQ